MLDVFEQLELGLCNIDQPLFKRSMKPSAVATSPGRLCALARAELPKLVYGKPASARALRLPLFA